VKRRPVSTGTQAPERLQRFVADEWDVPPASERTTEWEAERWSLLGPFHAWRDARRIWSVDHGDALGTFLERFQFERQVRLAHYSTIREAAD
jgi:hypothetical protein